MNSQQFTPLRVTKENLKFSIPLYQRLFAWSQSEVLQLLFDLLDHFKSPQDGRSYYLGVLTVIKLNDTEYSLIDGQQRFTVIMLLAICFNSKPYGSVWKGFLTDDRLKFIARSEDQYYIQQRINNEDLSDAYKNSKMDEALLAIGQFLEKDSHFKNINRETFVSSVFEHLTFFISVLPDNYLMKPASLNQYFELMNSTGRGLEQHEILKVELLKEECSLSDSEILTIWNNVSEMGEYLLKQKSDETREEYCQHYQNVIEKCSQNEYGDILRLLEEYHDEASNALAIIDIKKSEGISNFKQQYQSNEECIIGFSEFLLVVLCLVSEKDFQSNHFAADKLLSVFHENRPSDMKAFYHALLYYRLLLDYYVIKQNPISDSDKYALLIKDTSNKALRQYQSMLHVSNVKYEYRWMIPFLKLISQHRIDEPYNAEKLLVQLKIIDNKLNSHIDFTQLFYPSIHRYWFWRLDYYIWENEMKEKNRDRAIEEFTFKANRSIEHLHPQNQSFNSEWSNSQIHAFGNLAMISPSFNSTQSNDAVEVKFARVQSQIPSSLQSLKLYKMYLSAKQNNSCWTPQLAALHEKEMIEILKNSYKIGS